VSWRDEAACLDVDTDVFFPAKGDRPVEALAVCAVCDVRAECASWALEVRPQIGVFGGMLPRDRHHVVTGRLTVAQVWAMRDRQVEAWMMEAAS